MKFERQPRRHEKGFAWTPRKLAAAATRGARMHARERRRYPLLADQLPPSTTTFDPDAEAAARDAHARACQTDFRDFAARVWRESRRDARAATPEQQGAIREGWTRWTGPLTALYYRYVVDLHTGALDRRMQASKAGMYALVLEHRIPQQDLFTGLPAKES